MEGSGKKMEAHCHAAAKLFKTLSNPLRLSILCRLFQGEKTVTEIEESTKGSPFQISQFLKRMEYEHLVALRRNGNLYLLFEGSKLGCNL